MLFLMVMLLIGKLTCIELFFLLGSVKTELQYLMVSFIPLFASMKKVLFIEKFVPAIFFTKENKSIFGFATAKVSAFFVNKWKF